jgi:hypothetical protein
MSQQLGSADDSNLERPRDPEDRQVNRDSEHEKREKTHDKTLADSFPTSDPPSSIPDPAEDDCIESPA